MTVEIERKFLVADTGCLADLEGERLSQGYIASTGRAIRASTLASKSPAKPPRPPSTSGRCARRTDSFISSTALSPASTSTPAAAYVMGPCT